MTAGTRVVSAVELEPRHLAVLAECDVEVVDFTDVTSGRLAAALTGAHGLLVNSHAPVDAGMIASAPDLRAISTVSVGFDHLDVTAAHARGIAVTITPVLADAVADVTLALIVLVERRLREAMDDLGRGLWRNELLGRDVRGKELLIVGFGRIGREVARRALAAKMRVRAYDARPDVELAPDVERVSSLDEGLRRADVVSLHVDLNPSTRHLIDTRALGLMKHTAIIINTARGGVVDQDALTDALANGRLAGAGLDVLESEPPDADDPLLSMANVVVLPHIASATYETRAAMLDCAVENLANCLRGERCLHVLPR